MEAEPFEHDDLSQVLQRALRLLRRVGRPERAAVQVRAEEADVVDAELVAEPPWVASSRDGGCGVAVVTAIGGEDLASTGHRSGCPDRVLDRLGAAGGEQHVLEPIGRPLGHQTRGLAARLHGVVGGGRGQAFRLGDDRPDDAGVLVPGVREHQLRAEIEVPVALGVPYPGSSGPGQHGLPRHPLPSPRMPDVVPVGCQHSVDVGHAPIVPRARSRIGDRVPASVTRRGRAAVGVGAPLPEWRRSAGDGGRGVRTRYPSGGPLGATGRRPARRGGVVRSAVCPDTRGQRTPHHPPDASDATAQPDRRSRESRLRGSTASFISSVGRSRCTQAP